MVNYQSSKKAIINFIKSVLEHFPGFLGTVKKLKKRLQGKIEISSNIAQKPLNFENKKSLTETLLEAKELIAKIESFYSPEKELRPEEYGYKRELALLIASLLNKLSLHCRPYLYRPPLRDWMEGEPMKHLEGRAIPQGLIFMMDMYPAIRELIDKFPSNYAPEVLDVGGGSSAGAALLAMLHKGIKVTVMDIYSYIEPYVKARFPDVEFIVSDIMSFHNNRTWDIVIASHLLEHFAEPMPVIQEIKRRARHFVVLYAPYKEYERISAHSFTFTRSFVKNLKPIVFKRIKSKGWRNSHQCFLAVLKGRACAQTS